MFPPKKVSQLSHRNVLELFNLFCTFSDVQHSHMVSFLLAKLLTVVQPNPISYKLVWVYLTNEDSSSACPHIVPQIWSPSSSLSRCCTLLVFRSPALFYATWHGRRRVFAEPTQLQTWAYIMSWSCISGATVKPPDQTEKSLSA